MADVSVQVDIDRLSDELANFTFVYLVTVPPSRAVLQRKAAPGVATKPRCKDDCLPLEKR